MSNEPLLLKYFDAHCHVNFPDYNADRDDVMRRAREAGIGMILVGTDMASSQSAVELAGRHENAWAVIGLHPTDAAASFEYDFYKKLAAHPKVVGIGECGLDYFHGNPETDRAVQMKVFEDQIRLAHEMKKPLMLHVRNAYADVIEIIKKSKAAGMNVTGNVHFFAGGADIARQFIDLGFYLSFTGVITFAEEYHEVVRVMPLDRIISETDAPFVSPVPYRGKRNEPAYVVEVAKAIARIRASESEEMVLEALVNNVKKLFNV